MSHVEVHEDEEWSAVYLDGNLVYVGDAYLADEWVREHFGVVTVQNNAFMRGQTHRRGVAQTLDEVKAYGQERARLLAKAEQLRRQAADLLAQAEQVARG